MTHYSQIAASTFAKIKNGSKIIEPRLNDDAHRKIHLGDLIVFVNRQSNEEIVAKVVGLLRYQNFDELISAVPVKYFGYDMPGDVMQEIRQWYKPAAEQTYGILGIKLHVLRKN